jgi:hypothetical protein
MKSRCSTVSDSQETDPIKNSLDKLVAIPKIF